MPFKKGDPKPEGSGRKRGSLGKPNQELKDLIEEAADYTPWEFLIRCYTDTLEDRQGDYLPAPLELRVSCARELCQYLAPKKRSIEVSGALTTDRTPAEDAFWATLGEDEEDEDLPN